MATLSKQMISRAGLTPSYAAASGGGDAFANSGAEFLHIRNGGGSSVTLTIATQLNVHGLAVADHTVTVPAGEERLVGPFPVGTFNDDEGMVQLGYSGVTSVTVAVLRMGS